VNVGFHRGLVKALLDLRGRFSLRRLRRRAWEDGILGGETPWLIIGGVVWTLSAIGWALRREPEVVFRTRLKPGEGIGITTIKPDERGAKRGRKA
jgi:hypothetical protein